MRLTNRSYLNNSGTVWAPPYTGGPGQTTPPPLGGTVCACAVPKMTVKTGPAKKADQPDRLLRP